MGMFKDIKKLQQQSKEIDKTFDPGAQARAATEQMKAMNQQMAAANAAMAAPPADAVQASAQVVSVGAAAGMMNMDSIMPVEFLVTMPGQPPRPVSASVIVPIAQMSRLAAGATVTVRVSQSDPSSLAVDWAATAS